MGNVYAYVRVSTMDQNPDRQLAAMKQAGVMDSRVYLDKASGKNFARPQYQKLRKRVREGDCIYIKSIDRLGRNYFEILDEWKYLTKVKKVDIICLDMPLINTKKDGTLTQTFISDLILEILSFFAENERTEIRRRQREGIDAAKAHGVSFGRPELAMPENFSEIVGRWEKREISLKEAAILCGCSESTFRRRAKRL